MIHVAPSSRDHKVVKLICDRVEEYDALMIIFNNGMIEI